MTFNYFDKYLGFVKNYKLFTILNYCHLNTKQI